MKKLVTGFAVGCVLTCVVGLLFYDTSRRVAFDGGILTLCGSILDKQDERIFTDEKCVELFQASVDKKYFEQWDAARK